MNSIKNILVGLDLSAMDEVLIKYTSWFAELLELEHVYFVHNVKKYEISELFKEQLAGVDLETVIGDELTEKVETHYSSKIPFKVLISEDSYTESLMSYVVNKYQIDLAIVGNKPDEKGTGVITDKLLRVLRCPMMLVPEGESWEMKNIWAGIDFSKHSAWLFDTIDFLQLRTGAGVCATHVYQIPAQFSNYISLDTMKSKLEKHSNDRLRKFVNKLDKDYEIKSRAIDSKEYTVAQNLIICAQENHADLIIVGDKGSNTLYSLLVGGVASELASSATNIPLCIMK